MATVYSMYVINKSGGLIFSKVQLYFKAGIIRPFICSGCGVADQLFVWFRTSQRRLLRSISTTRSG